MMDGQVEIMAVADVLRSIVDMTSVDILASEKLMGYFLDFAPQMKREARLIKLGIKTGVYSALVEHIGSTDSERRRQIEIQKMRLTEDEFLEEKWADTMLSWVTSVIYSLPEKQQTTRMMLEEAAFDTPQKVSIKPDKEIKESLLKPLLGLAPQENIRDVLEYLEDNFKEISEEVILFCADMAGLYADNERIQEENRSRLGKFAAKYWEELAFRGNARAQNSYAELLLKHDYPEGSLKWLNKSAVAGYVESQRELGDIYANSKKSAEYSVKPNIIQAEKWYRLAAEQGDKAAGLRLGFLFDRYRKSYEVDNLDPKSEEGSYERIWHDMVWLGFLSSYILVPDDEKAEYWYTVVAQNGYRKPLEDFLAHKKRLSATPWSRNGHKPTQSQYTEKFSGERLPAGSLAQLEIAATRGCRESQRELGDVYFNKEKAKLYSVDTDARKAERWYRLAAEQGDEVAELRLGYLHDCRRKRHVMGEPDTRLKVGVYAQTWYDMVMNQSFLNSVLLPDDEQAEYWYTVAAKKGYSQPLVSFLQNKDGTFKPAPKAEPAEDDTDIDAIFKIFNKF